MIFIFKFIINLHFPTNVSISSRMVLISTKELACFCLEQDDYPKHRIFVQKQSSDLEPVFLYESMPSGSFYVAWIICLLLQSLMTKNVFILKLVNASLRCFSY